MRNTIITLCALACVIGVVYLIWAVQPLSFDDWENPVERNALFRAPPIPESGQRVRYSFDGRYFLPANPFSIFQPWSFFVVVFLALGAWKALDRETVVTRMGMTVLLLLGFPYLGHVGPWNLCASEYALSLFLAFLWYRLLKVMQTAKTMLVPRLSVFLIFTFMAAVYHEVWLITFGVLAMYLLGESLWGRYQPQHSPLLKKESLRWCVVVAVFFAMAFYMNGGMAGSVDNRLGKPGYFAGLFTGPQLIKSFMLGTKEILVLLKDVFPVFIVLAFFKSKDNRLTGLSKDFRLFLVACCGAFAFMYIHVFLLSSPHWRLRWICAAILCAAFYALPPLPLSPWTTALRDHWLGKGIRKIMMGVAIVWLCHTAYYTYVDINIDVAGWWQYRQVVLKHGPAIFDGSGRWTLPSPWTLKVFQGNHPWGAQDDRYRFFMGPGEQQVQLAAVMFWKGK